jgi:aminomethyltransferase
LLVDGKVPADMGDAVYSGDKKVGVVTCAMVSSLTGKSMAIARLDVPAAVHGTQLEVRGKNVKASAIAHTLPFDDPDKKKRTAVG